ncbi:MAG: 16S rRNA (guanine(966)-N(2))-methyltransferase RsmD [Planctomycetota bacterium]|nr:16S rRNA (guanine(966)-N(2))-methyltransferase RsmD [Planctomycetota bacterium]
MTRNGSLRISSGQLRGRKIEVPAGLTVRPMRSRVRESLFNSIQDHLEAARVLDVFAGSGALGIEAVSRGARQAVHVEKDPAVGQLLEKNLKVLGIQAQCKILQADAYRLPEEPAPGGEFEIILIDPPFPDYSQPGQPPWQLAQQLAASQWLKPGGLLAMEHPVREDAAPAPPGLKAWKGKRYGETRLTIWEKESADQPS